MVGEGRRLPAGRAVGRGYRAADARPLAKGRPAKNKVEQVGVSSGPRKRGLISPRFTTRFTTTSPRFTIQKRGGNRKTPCKNAISVPRNFFSDKNRRIEAWESAGKTPWTVFRAMI
jgi:hypothetical protein